MRLNTGVIQLILLMILVSATAHGQVEQAAARANRPL